MTEAIFGLLGVVVGGALTGGIDVLAKRREERAMMRALARTIFAALTDLRSQCVYCRKLGTWLLVAEPLRLPAAWTDHELTLGRLLTWDEWVGLHAVRVSQFALRMLAVQATEEPSLQQTHLPTVTDAAVDAIDNVLPALERLAGSGRATMSKGAPGVDAATAGRDEAADG
jgi:hypothetical protein